MNGEYKNIFCYIIGENLLFYGIYFQIIFKNP